MKNKIIQLVLTEFSRLWQLKIHLHLLKINKLLCSYLLNWESKSINKWSDQFPIQALHKNLNLFKSKKNKSPTLNKAILK